MVLLVLHFSAKKEGTARIFFSLPRTVPLLLLFLILLLNPFGEVGQVDPALGFFFESCFCFFFLCHQLSELCGVGGVFHHLVVNECYFFFQSSDIIVNGFVLALFLKGKFQADRTVLLPVVVFFFSGSCIRGGTCIFFPVPARMQPVFAIAV